VGSPQRTIKNLYYNGGGHFLLPSPLPPTVDILATYATPLKLSTSPDTDRPVAAVLSRKGKGKALLCSVHVEYPLGEPPARDAIARKEPAPERADIEESEMQRIEWVTELLCLLDLKPPGRRKTDTTEMLGGENSTEDPSLLLHPTHPSPVFVLHHPALPQLASTSFAKSALVEKLVSSDDGWRTLRDGNDELLVGETEQVDKESGVATYLAERRRSRPSQLDEPDLSHLSLSTDAQPIPQPPDFHSIPKTILLPSASLPYIPRWTPLFNFETYWAELDQARKRVGRRSGVLRKDQVEGGERATLGDLVWYGETVTSTQTMLDR
jgi:biotin--protein ligase